MGERERTSVRGEREEEGREKSYRVEEDLPFLSVEQSGLESGSRQGSQTRDRCSRTASALLAQLRANTFSRPVRTHLDTLALGIPFATLKQMFEVGHLPFERHLRTQRVNNWLQRARHTQRQRRSETYGTGFYEFRV